MNQIEESFYESIDKDEFLTFWEGTDNIRKIVGTSIKLIVENLIHVRSRVSHGSWEKWLNSGIIPLSSRTIKDLIRASEWILTTEVPEEILGRLGKRTMCLISELDDDQIKEVETQLMTGKKIPSTRQIQTLRKTPKRNLKQEVMDKDRMIDGLLKSQEENLKRDNEYQTLFFEVDSQLRDPDKFVDFVVVRTEQIVDQLSNESKVILLKRLSDLLNVTVQI